MTTVEFFVRWTPKAQPRPRATVVGGRPRIYDPTDAKQWRTMVRLAWTQARAETLAGPLRCDVDFFLPRPRSHYRTGRNAHTLKGSAPSMPAAKPDLSNLIKGTEDALNSTRGSPGAWRDDAQICTMVARKRYAELGDEPGAWICICTL